MLESQEEARKIPEEIPRETPFFSNPRWDLGNIQWSMKGRGRHPGKYSWRNEGIIDGISKNNAEGIPKEWPEDIFIGIPSQVTFWWLISVVEGLRTFKKPFTFYFMAVLRNSYSIFDWNMLLGLWVPGKNPRRNSRSKSRKNIEVISGGTIPEVRMNEEGIPDIPREIPVWITND